MELVIIDKPIKDTNGDATDDLVFNTEVDEYVKRKSALRENLKTVYSLIWGQCTEYLRAKLESTKNYIIFEKKQDPIGLLKEIKTITFKHEDHQYLYNSLFEAYRNFFTYRQGPNKNNTEFLEQFKNVVDVLEQHGGTIGIDDVLMMQDDDYAPLYPANITNDDITECKDRCRQRMLGYCFLYKSDNYRYNKLKQDLYNDYMKGGDTFPDSLVDAYHMLTNYKIDSKIQVTKNTGVVFAQKGKGKKIIITIIITIVMVIMGTTTIITIIILIITKAITTPTIIQIIIIIVIIVIVEIYLRIMSVLSVTRWDI